MTAVTPDYAPAESARPAPPAGLVLLLGLVAAVATLQSVLGGWTLFHGHGESIAGAVAEAAHGRVVADLPERLIIGLVLLVHLAAAAGFPVLAVAAFRALLIGGGGAAKSLGRLLRLALYMALLTAFVTFPGPSDRGPHWLLICLWAARVLAAVGLPVVLLGYLRVSGASRRRYGGSFLLQLGDEAMRSLSRDGAIGVVLMLAALVLVVFVAALPSIKAYGPDFLVSSEWRPNSLPGGIKHDAQGNAVIDPDTGETAREPDRPPVFGAMPVIWGTAVTSLIAVAFAVPLSFGAAVFLVRVAPRVLVPPVSFLIEFLAAIPSIAYGIWGLFVLGPFLATEVEPLFLRAYEALGSPHVLAWLFNYRKVDPDGTVTLLPVALTGYDTLCGGLILAVMIVPIITAISRDVLRAVPRAQMEGTAALGATWWQSSKEMLKYSRSGLFGAVMLGLARAAGETMAVTMVIGNNPQIKFSPFMPAQTMSSLLASQFAEADSAEHRSALFEVALILLVMSLAFNIVARYLVVGKGSRTAAAH